MATRSELEEKIKKFEDKLKSNPSEVVKKNLERGLRDLKNDLKMIADDVDKDAKDVKKDVKKVVKKVVKTAKKVVKKTKSDIEKAKEDLKKKTGKTEEECEKIIEQYKSLRSQSNTRKKAEKKQTDNNKKRVSKLKDTGKTISGTTEKTAEAELESTKKKVEEKLDKEIKKEVKKVEEVIKKEKLEPKKEKEKVSKKVDEKVKTITTKVSVDTSGIIKAISSSLNDFSPENSKVFLLKLRNDIDKLLKDYQYGGSTPSDFIQTLDVAQGVKPQANPILYTPNSSPQEFSDGGSIGDIKNSIADYLNKETDYNFDAEYLDWEEINSVDELENACTDSDMYYQMGEVIYYSNAMEYLSENDASLNESLGLASDMGYEVGNLNSEILASLLKGEEMRDSLVEAIRSDFVEEAFEKIEEYQEEEDEEEEEFAKGGRMKRQGYNDKIDESLAMRRGKRMSKRQNYKDRRDESKGISKSMGRRAYASVGTMDKGNRMMKRGGKSDWIEDVVDSPKFRKGDFTKKAKARNLSTTSFMKKVLSNPNRYDERTVKQARFMKNVQ